MCRQVSYRLSFSGFWVIRGWSITVRGDTYRVGSVAIGSPKLLVPALISLVQLAIARAITVRGNTYLVSSTGDRQTVGSDTLGETDSDLDAMASPR